VTSALYSLGPIIQNIAKWKGVDLEDGDGFFPPPFEVSGSLDQEV